MYFFDGSAVCVKLIPVLAVTSSSCGIGRPLHLVDFAPGGGGTGGGWPSCACSRLAQRRKMMNDLAGFFKDSESNMRIMDSASAIALCAVATWLSAPGKPRVRDLHRLSGLLSGRQPVIDSGRIPSRG